MVAPLVTSPAVPRRVGGSAARGPGSGSFPDRSLPANGNHRRKRPGARTRVKKMLASLSAAKCSFEELLLLAGTVSRLDGSNPRRWGRAGHQRTIPACSVEASRRFTRPASRKDSDRLHQSGSGLRWRPLPLPVPWYKVERSVREAPWSPFDPRRARWASFQLCATREAVLAKAADRGRHGHRPEACDSGDLAGGRFESQLAGVGIKVVELAIASLVNCQVQLLACLILSEPVVEQVEEEALAESVVIARRWLGSPPPLALRR